MTSLWRATTGYLIFMPIAGLLLVGALIALHSGVRELRSPADFLKLVGNLSQMLVRIVGYVAILIAVQYLVGLRPSLGW